MSKEGRFLIFCIEIYRSAKNLKGKEVMQLFQKYNVCEYIMECYGALHTTGENYIISDINSCGICDIPCGAIYYFVMRYVPVAREQSHTESDRELQNNKRAKRLSSYIKKISALALFPQL